MKSRKGVRPLPQPEECGVWLDASQMKRRSQQAVILCTSTRFNPLSRRQSTDSVLVEFTQTKSPQPYTKQTSMYSFFSPAGNKNKQSCITDNTLIQEASPEFVGNNEQEAPKVMKPSPTGPSVCLSQTYIDCEPTANQESASSCKTPRNAEKSGSSGGAEDYDWVLDKRHNRDGGFIRASIYRSQEKSLSPPPNYWATGFGSKHQNNLSDSPISKSPDKKCSTEDLLPSCQFEDQLFTQDTQGNRVICHRFMKERGKTAYPAVPLQDKTNVTWKARSPMKEPLHYLCEEESLQNMFTQNSEGNLVIKH
ncbi:aurora kinase A- and ninein-interacting protein isoform X1 [Eleutherodactylus coqui]|uniref:aurora kinase A- and ninein-interacting protein isoform X1 n=1 Tax=Eleutherodactylus coqui TaxID=57060 RepID=UPI003461EE03